MNFRELFFFFFLCLGSLMTSAALGKVVLIGRNVTLSFGDVEASFAPLVKESKKGGTLYMAEPLDACLPLTNKLDSVNKSTNLPFVLIIRGRCSFESKVRRAQAAGFKAAIIYDNVFGDLVGMAGSSAGIKIPAVFVSRRAGEILAEYASDSDMDLWIVPSFEKSVGSILAMSSFMILAMLAMMATCYFVQTHNLRRISRRVREFHGMGSRLVKALPSLIFTAVVGEDNSTSTTCAICLEDYSIGDRLRNLPCSHKFHAMCVDAWLTSWRSFCPVCKRDARTRVGEPPASESTPLLSSTSSSCSLDSSVRSTFAADSRLHSSYHLPHPSTNQISIDFRNASSQRSHDSYLVSTHSLGYPSLSSLYPSYISPGNASSSSFIVSSSLQPNSLQRSESNASFSPFASAHSLPDCLV